MIYIKTIQAEDTYLIRQAILRKGKPLESCIFHGDHSPNTFHFGLYLDEELIGVLSVFTNHNTQFSQLNQLQLRGMAILENHQKKGYGKKLIQHIENYFVLNTETLLWFNARVNAVAFYEKLGYSKSGEVFVIDDIGPHFVMYKA
jgi:GNAT superfamily N-acetyltransferase